MISSTAHEWLWLVWGNPLFFFHTLFVLLCSWFCYCYLHPLSFHTSLRILKLKAMDINHLFLFTSKMFPSWLFSFWPPDFPGGEMGSRGSWTLSLHKGLGYCRSSIPSPHCWPTLSMEPMKKWVAVLAHISTLGTHQNHIYLLYKHCPTPSAYTCV